LLAVVLAEFLEEEEVLADIYMFLIIQSAQME
jgi:hypothetical protein